MSPDPRSSPVYVGSEIYRNASYGPKHPLAISRVSVCTDLCRALGWLSDAVYLEAPVASRAELGRFHYPAYLVALRRAEATQSVSESDRHRFRLGAAGNAIYPEMYRRPAVSAGGVILAARLTLEGGIAHCPGGGTHHGRPDRASGFCFINDPVLGLYAWLDAGLDNIVYLDIDAHHGDGVQDAFHADPRVLTISIHEEGRWPFSGAAADRAGGDARNLPVPPGFNDSEMHWLMRHAVLPLIEARRPQAIMLQCGADALAEDPLSKLALSNNAHWNVVDTVRRLAPRLVVLGGGGYNPWSVGRCWAGVWATLNQFPVPERLAQAAELVLRNIRYDRAAGRDPPEHWFTTLRDPLRAGTVRDEIKRLADRSLSETQPV